MNESTPLFESSGATAAIGSLVRRWRRRNPRRRGACGLAAGIVLACAGCGEPAESRGTARSTIREEVYTTFHPTAYWARRIAGDLVPVVNPCPAAADPESWSPGSAEIAAYQGARLIVVNGAEFERWTALAALPRSRVVVTTDAFADELIEADTTTHSHGPAGDHAHGAIDGHTWLDPGNAMRQAASIRDAMSEAFPEHADAFAHGYASLETDLRGLDAALSALDPGSRVFLANHAAYDYLARRYDWALTNLDLDPQGDPDVVVPAVRAALDARPDAPARDRGVVLLWESPPTQAIAAPIESMGVRNVVFAPAESVGDGEDYLDVMRDNIARLEEALR